MGFVFEATSIKGLSLPNRFVRSATWEGMADDDGNCMEKLVNLMVQLAQGGVGIIISGFTCVSLRGDPDHGIWRSMTTGSFPVLPEWRRSSMMREGRSSSNSK